MSRVMIAIAKSLLNSYIWNIHHCKFVNSIYKLSHFLCGFKILPVHLTIIPIRNCVRQSPFDFPFHNALEFFFWVHFKSLSKFFTKFQEFIPLFALFWFLNTKNYCLVPTIISPKVSSKTKPRSRDKNKYYNC